MNLKKKYLFLFLIIFVSFNINFLFSYTPTKSTEIVANPNKYVNKDVLVYIKFDYSTGNIGGYGYFTDLNVKGINYRYKLSNKKVKEEIEKFKNRDKLTVKGKVILDGFLVIIDIDSVDKDWVDTNLLPATPDTISITCPRCGETFKYKITDKDYKNSVIDNRKNDTITKVVPNNNANIKNNKKNSINTNSNIDNKNTTKNKTNTGFSFD